MEPSSREPWGPPSRLKALVMRALASLLHQKQAEHLWCLRRRAEARYWLEAPCKPVPPRMLERSSMRWLIKIRASNHIIVKNNMVILRLAKQPKTREAREKDSPVQSVGRLKSQEDLTHPKQSIHRL